MKKAASKKYSIAEAKALGERLGITWEEFDVEQFREGLNAEIADGTYNPTTGFATDDPIVVGKIVRAHLNEAADYYTQWAKAEKAAARGKRTG